MDLGAIVTMTSSVNDTSGEQMEFDFNNIETVVTAHENPSSEEEINVPEANTENDLVKKIVLGLTSDGDVKLDLDGNFRSHEFYGVMFATVIDVITNNIVNAVYERTKGLVGQDSGKLKEDLLKVLQGA